MTPAPPKGPRPTRPSKRSMAAAVDLPVESEAKLGHMLDPKPNGAAILCVEPDSISVVDPAVVAAAEQVEQAEQAGQVVNFCDYAAAFDSAVACIYTRRSRLLTDTDSVCSCTVTSLLFL